MKSFKEKIAEYKEKKEEKDSKVSKKWEKGTLRNQKKLRAKSLIYNYRNVDKGKGLDMNLTEDWVIENIFRKKCIYCGEHDWRELGCDRKDNTKGHTTDNVVCACKRCNMIRGDQFTMDEMKMIGKVIKMLNEKRKKVLKLDRKMRNGEKNPDHLRKAKRVAKCDKYGRIVEKYHSAAVTEEYGYVAKMVRRACERFNDGYTYRGFLWRYI